MSLKRILTAGLLNDAHQNGHEREPFLEMSEGGAVEYRHVGQPLAHGFGLCWRDLR